jgi:hypothetical protein
MIYNEKIQTLLDSLYGKLGVLQNVATGAQQMDYTSLNQTIEDSKKLVERISELVNINR